MFEEQKENKCCSRRITFQGKNYEKKGQRTEILKVLNSKECRGMTQPKI